MQVQLQFAIEGAQFVANWGGVSGHQKGFRSRGREKCFEKELNNKNNINVDDFKDG